MGLEKRQIHQRKERGLEGVWKILGTKQKKNCSNFCCSTCSFWRLFSQEKKTEGENVLFRRIKKPSEKKEHHFRNLVETTFVEKNIILCKLKKKKLAFLKNCFGSFRSLNISVFQKFPLGLQV